MEDAATVGASRGCCAVGIENQLPAPSMHSHEMVESAEQAAVRDRSLAPVGAWSQVMDVAADRGPVAAGEPAAPVPASDGAADLHGDRVGCRADVERQADGTGRRGQLAAEQGRKPAGS